MTLKLAIEISADATGARKGAAEASAALGEISQSAQASGEAVARATSKMAADAEKAAQRIRAANANSASSAQAIDRRMGVRDDFGGAARAADIDAYARALNDLRAQFSPLYAVQRAYVAQLGEIRDAQRVGALSAQETAAAIARTKAAFAGAVTRINGTDQAAAEANAQARALDDLRARYSPLYAAQRTYLAQLREIRAAEKAGALSAQEAAAAITKTKAAFADAVPRLRGSAGSVWSQLRPDQRVNLGYQINDVFGSALSGISPTMIAAQQGPQIVQALGGVKPTIAAVTGALTPLTIGLGAVTAAVGLGASAWYSYTRATKEAATVAASFGRSAGVTASDIERSAQLNAAPAGLSVSEARQVATELTRTGRIGSDLFAGLTATAKDFATTLGTDVADAAQQLGQIFANPSQGADQLQQLGLLDSATARLTKTLAEQGQQEQAQQALLDGLRQRLASTADASFSLGRVWDSVSRRGSDLFGGLGRWLAGGEVPLEQQLAQARRSLAAVEQPTSGAITYGPEEIERWRQRVADLERQLAEQQKAASERQSGARLSQAGGTAVALAAADPVNAQIRERIQLEAQLKALRAGEKDPSQTAQEQQLVARAIEGVTSRLKALAEARQTQVEIDRLDLQIGSARDPQQKAQLVYQRELLAASQRGVLAAQAQGQAEDARRRSLEASAQAAKDAARTILEGSRDQIEQLKLEISLIGASNAQRQQAIALLRAEQQIRAQAIDPASEDAAKIRSGAAAGAQLQARIDAGTAAHDIRKSGADQEAQLSVEIGLIGQSNALRARRLALLEAEQQIRDRGIDATSQDAQEIRAQAVRNADLATRLQAAQAVRGQWEANRDQNEQLQLEAQLIGASSQARARAVAVLQLEQQLRAAGIASGSAEAQMLRQQVIANVDLAQALERRRDAASTLTGSLGGALDSLGDALATNAGSWSTWRDAIDSVVGDIEKTLIKLAITNPLKNALFGGNAGTLADLGAGGGGGLVGSLLGGVLGNRPQTAAPAQPAAAAATSVLPLIGGGALSAGVVNVSGSIINVGGGLGGAGLGGLPNSGAGIGTGATGAGVGTTVLGNITSGGVATLAAARARFAGELSDPGLQQMLFARVASENGGAGATAQIESMLNRGIAQGKSLQEIMGGSYWAKDGTANMRSMLASGRVPDYSGNLREVMGGSNVSNYATGNASYAPGNDHFNRYPFGEGGFQTAKINGELYGQEAGTVGWQDKLGGAQQQVQQLGTTVQQTSSSVGTFGQGLGQATSSIGDFGTGITDATRSVSTSLGSSSGQISGAGTQLATATQQTASSATGFAGGIGQALNGIVSAISQAVSGLGSGLASAIGGIFGGGGTSLFAMGGVMTSAGPLPLRAYSTGGVADRPQLALFGEGSQAEAYVPLPDGRRIPVAMRMDGRGSTDTGGAANSGASVFALAASVTALAQKVTAAPASRPLRNQVVVHNYAGAQIRTEEQQQADGSMRTEVQIDKAVKSGLARAGSESAGFFQSRFKVAKQVVSG